MPRFASVEEYIASFDQPIQKKLKELNRFIAELIPYADPVISYNMPAYKFNKVVVYFAGYKNHIGFYPTAKPIEYFKNELQAFTFSKGAIQFKLNESLPFDLIEKLVLFRMEMILNE
jgi:uncharacterized protein YdhG (YjbR/CyaY superfamily)